MELNHQFCGHGRRKNDTPNHSATLPTIFLINAKSKLVSILQENQHDPMEFCFHLIKELRASSQLEKEFREFYKKLEHQIEDFMCNLLDQVL